MGGERAQGKRGVERKERGAGEKKGEERRRLVRAGDRTGVGEKEGDRRGGEGRLGEGRRGKGSGRERRGEEQRRGVERDHAILFHHL